MKIGFIGLGRMGSAMARNLIHQGNAVTVFNRSREKAEALSREGARVAASPREASLDAEAVFTMLADDHAVEGAVFGDDGIAAGLPKGSIHISSSTISTALARRLADEHAAHGQGYLSAPVFGRPEAADAKRLLVVPGGDGELIGRVRPLFAAIGRAVFVAGSEPWQANAIKLCGNFMIVCVLESFGEAFATMRKAGVDPHLFLEIMNTLFASPVVATYGGIIADEKYEPAGFALKLGLKDVRLAMQTAEECASPMPMASVIHDQFVSAMAHGQAEIDWSSVARVSARNAGL